MPILTEEISAKPKGKKALRLPFYKSLRFKLFVFTSVLVTALLATTAFLDGNYLFSQLLLSRHEQTISGVRSMANNTESILDSWYSQLVTMTNGLAFNKEEYYEKTIEAYTKSHPDFVGFFLIPENKDGSLKDSISSFSNFETDQRTLDKKPEKVKAAISKTLDRWVSTPKKGKANNAAINLGPQTGLPLLALGLSFDLSENNGRVWAFLVLWQTRVVSSMIPEEEGFVAVYDKSGRIISSNSLAALISAKRVPYKAQINDLKRNRSPSGLREWKTSRGQRLFGSWGILNGHDLKLISVTSGDPVYAALEQIIKRSVLLAIFVTLLSVLASFIAASNTTKHIKALMNSAMEIARGNFKSKVMVKSGDEIGVLGNIVNYMSAELENLVDTKTQKAKLDSELETAKAVQEAFIPDEKKFPDEFSVKAFYQPAEACGGDWWGHFRINDDLHLVAIADATGHGIPAALVTAMIYSMTSMAAKDSENKTAEEISPASMLANFNKALCAKGARQHTLTCFLALFDLRKGTIKFSNAGHNIPLYYQAPEEGSSDPFKRKGIQMPGNPLGLDIESVYNDKSLDLSAGDRWIFYTDGLIECTNAAGEAWGRGDLQRLLKTNIVKQPEAIAESIVNAAFTHFNGFPLGDDITLVVIEYKGRDEWHIELDHTA